MLTGCTPPEETRPPFTGRRVPSDLMRSTESWLLPALTASRNRPSSVTWSAPCEPMAAPSRRHQSRRENRV
jgi:hypothetical protein